MNIKELAAEIRKNLVISDHNGEQAVGEYVELLDAIDRATIISVDGKATTVSIPNKPESLAAAAKAACNAWETVSTIETRDKSMQDLAAALEREDS